MKSVAVYLGSKSGNMEIFMQSARELGRALAVDQYRIVYGGASVGTMKALADGALEAGGVVTGVFPDNFKGKKESQEKKLEIRHTALSEMVVVRDMSERKKVMEELSDCCIILPGSFGTLDELFEYAVHRQLEFHLKPIFILNTEGYYNPLKEQIRIMAMYGFIRPEEELLFTFCDTPEDILNILNILNDSLIRNTL